MILSNARTVSLVCYQIAAADTCSKETVDGIMFGWQCGERSTVGWNSACVGISAGLTLLIDVKCETYDTSTSLSSRVLGSKGK